MSTELPTIMPILATPLGLVALADAAELNPTLHRKFTQRIAGDSRALPGALTYHSADDLLEWDDESVKSLTAGMIRGVYAVVGGVNAFTPDRLESFGLEARGWFSVVRTNGAIPAALYPLTAWCAIYCVAAPPAAPDRQDSGVLRLYESRLGTMFQDATNAAMCVPFMTSHYAWRPVPGELAVFPASVVHEIATLRSPGELVLVTMRLRFFSPGQQGYGRW